MFVGVYVNTRLCGCRRVTVTVSLPVIVWTVPETGSVAVAEALRVTEPTATKVMVKAPALAAASATTPELLEVMVMFESAACAGLPLASTAETVTVTGDAPTCAEYDILSASTELPSLNESRKSRRWACRESF